MDVQQAPEAAAPSPGMVRRAIVGASVGSVVEWFDVAVYGYLAVTLGKVFFPSGNPTAQVLSSLAVFGAAFVVRPLGGLFFGGLGDRLGRQKILVAVITLVSASTFVIGLLPGYAAAGVFAPALLVLMRLLQGFSAGGEMGGASAFAAEYAKPRNRGHLVSWVEMGCIAGFLLGSVLVLVLNVLISDAGMLSWGWRIPFLVGGPLGAICFYIRRRIDETPEFRALASAGKVAKSPLRETFRHNWRGILKTAGFSLFHNAFLYVVLTFMPTYFTVNLHFTSDDASISAVIAMTVVCVLIPLFGALSDRVGRKPMLTASCVASIVLAYPVFAWMNSGSLAAAIGGHVVLGILLALFISTSLAAMNELFATRVRYGGFSIGYNISVSAFGGTAPFIVSLLITATGNPVAPAFYVIGTALVTLAVIPTVMETAVRRMRAPAADSA
ncbi:MAG TPA: MFS transporter [Streptosporangiaceae bacterium]|jgi:MHS family proline/betaine transporter-like MFS transporter